MVQPVSPLVTALQLKNVSPSMAAMVSVAIARYRPFSRTEIAPTRMEMGSVASAASGMQSQNGQPHDDMAMAVTTVPTPANEYGMSEMRPAYPVTTVTDRPMIAYTSAYAPT